MTKRKRDSQTCRMSFGRIIDKGLKRIEIVITINAKQSCLCEKILHINPKWSNSTEHALSFVKRQIWIRFFMICCVRRILWRFRGQNLVGREKRARMKNIYGRTVTYND